MEMNTGRIRRLRNQTNAPNSTNHGEGGFALLGKALPLTQRRSGGLSLTSTHCTIRRYERSEQSLETPMPIQQEKSSVRAGYDTRDRHGGGGMSVWLRRRVPFMVFSAGTFKQYRRHRGEQ